MTTPKRKSPQKPGAATKKREPGPTRKKKPPTATARKDVAATALAAIALGEDSTRQFKRDVTNGDALAAEMVAFANAEGGTIFLGVADDGTTPGLSAQDVKRLNQLIGNTANHAVRSPLTVQTKNVALPNGRVVIVLTVPKGLDKPYFDKNGVIWLKAGADKRRVNSKEEGRSPKGLRTSAPPRCTGCLSREQLPNKCRPMDRALLALDLVVTEPLVAADGVDGANDVRLARVVGANEDQHPVLRKRELDALDRPEVVDVDPFQLHAASLRTECFCRRTVTAVLAMASY